MENLIKQLVTETTWEAQYITNVTIDEERHHIDFRINNAYWMWAKLSKNNKKVLKNSVRRLSFG